MASLVDPQGFPVSSKLLHAAQKNTGDRPYWRDGIRDTEKDIPFQDWRTVVSYSRRLYANDGLVKGAIDQMAQHAVGRAWNPNYTGEDAEWGKQAEQWLTEEWFGVCDVRGDQWDFKTSLFNDSVALDVDGDFLVILTETEGGFPALQHLPAHKLGVRDTNKTTVEKGPLRGFRIQQGVILNDLNRVVGVRVLGETEKDDRDVIANNCIFCFNATRADQIRGLPTFSHAINELRDAWQSQQWEQITHQLASSIGLIEHNELGAADPNDPGTVLGETGTNEETFTSKRMEGGMIRYFKAGSGAKLEEFLSNKPGPAWEAFQERIFKKALVGACWPYALCWPGAGLTGPAERSQIELARATILDRQELLQSVALREIRYALSKAMNIGRIPRSTDWWRWKFTLPPKFSIDNGRDGQSRREDYKLGHKNLRGILGEQGIAYDHHRRERKGEVADLLTDALEVANKKEVPFGLVLSLMQQQTATASVGGGMNGQPVADPNDPAPEPAPVATPPQV
jgi:hypothetical protein